MTTFPVQCQKADGRPYTIDVPADSPEAAHRWAESVGHVVLGAVDSRRSTPTRPAPESAGASTTALVLSWFGFICPLLAMVGIAIGAGQKSPRGRNAVAIGVIALMLWTIGGIGYAAQLAGSGHRETSDEAFQRLRAEIDSIGK